MSKAEVMKKYGDIIDLPHHRSKTRKHMSMVDRACQFSPFAALTGLDDTMRATEVKSEEEILMSLEHYDQPEESL